MYLTRKQCNSLRNIIMNIEVPFRSYVSITTIEKYKTADELKASILVAISKCTDLNLKSQLAKFVTDFPIIYEKLEFAFRSYQQREPAGNGHVPSIGEINSLTLGLDNDFSDLINHFTDYTNYKTYVSKFRYIRNKVDHPESKRIEELEMKEVLSFTSELLAFLDDKYFWNENKTSFKKEIESLLSNAITIPIQINNFDEMPFTDMKIVCREDEIKILKTYMYGRPGALRKNTSLCLYGYGGVGKTALVLEAVKEIVEDILDNTTNNNYSPDFILFFTAKTEMLSMQETTGMIENRRVKNHFDSCNSLKAQIFKYLNINSFSEFDKAGIIVVDNLKSLSKDQKDLVNDFIQYESPLKVQYIITSRNEESFQVRQPVNDFRSFDSGRSFISNYIEENELDVDMSEEDKNRLLAASKGNTLVLVLSLRRLSKGLYSINGIEKDLNIPSTITKIENELQYIPPNGYEVISEFMFKNTFGEIETMLQSSKQQRNNLYGILKVFAVYAEEDIDVYTISIIVKASYSEVEPLIILLCRYLILEKRSDSYSLNQFASKYIIQRFLPDRAEYLKLDNEIRQSIREINRETEEFERQIEQSSSLKKIVNDWIVKSRGDRIVAAKANALYAELNIECHRGNKYFTQIALDEALKKISVMERTTMHPYVKYEKARILQVVRQSVLLDKKYDAEILEAFRDAIFIIKTNPEYAAIKMTNSFAIVTMQFGIENSRSHNYSESIRNFEDAESLFSILQVRDKNYFQCLSWLGTIYYEYYKADVIVNHIYLHKSVEMCKRLNTCKEKWRTDRNTARHIYDLQRLLKAHGAIFD